MPDNTNPALDWANPHSVTRAFEKAICAYTGSPYCIALDNESNALFMALTYVGIKGKEITIPSHTYPSVPYEIINAGGKVKFDPGEGTLRNLSEDERENFIKLFGHDKIKFLKGEYRLKPTNVWDSALRFTAGMYRPGQIQCLSFTGQYKRLRTVKGGAILTDSAKAEKWFHRFSFSGRNTCSYHIDTFDFPFGHNFYMPHALASIGLLALSGFYTPDKTPKSFDDIELPYPDLSDPKNTAFITK